MAKVGKHSRKEPISLGQIIEEVTAQSSENWMIFMQICDIINSSSEGPKDAIKSIRKRFGTKSPSVIKISLMLLETCVKNCGMRFHVQIASRDFLHDFLKIISSKNNPSMELQMSVLGLLQNWAISFQGIPELTEVCKTYHDLKNKNVEFPPVDLEQVSQLHSPLNNATVSSTGTDNAHRDQHPSVHVHDSTGYNPSEWNQPSATLSPSGTDSRNSRSSSPGYLRRPSLTSTGVDHLKDYTSSGVRLSSTTLSPSGTEGHRSRSPSPYRLHATLSPTGDDYQRSSRRQSGGNIHHEQQNRPQVSRGPATINTSELRSELTTIQQNCKMFVEMLSALMSEKDIHSDKELLEDLNMACQKMKKRIVQLLETLEGDDFTAELLSINDELNDAFRLYEKYVSSTADEKGGLQASAAGKECHSGKVSQRPANKHEDTVVNDLIDLSDSSTTSSTVPDINSQLGLMSLHNKKDVHCTSSGDAVAKERMVVDREQDLAEMEKWVKENEGVVQENFNSEFEQFLQARARQTDSKSTQHL